MCRGRPRSQPWQQTRVSNCLSRDLERTPLNASLEGESVIHSLPGQSCWFPRWFFSPARYWLNLRNTLAFFFPPQSSLSVFSVRKGRQGFDWWRGKMVLNVAPIQKILVQSHKTAYLYHFWFTEITMPCIWQIVQSDIQCPSNRKTYSQQLLANSPVHHNKKSRGSALWETRLSTADLCSHTLRVRCASRDRTLDPDQRAGQDKGFVLWVYPRLMGSQAIFSYLHPIAPISHGCSQTKINKSTRWV